MTPTLPRRIAARKSLALPGLRAARLALALSQRDLAQRAGVSHSTIVGIETGRRGAYPMTVRRLAAGLGCPLAALYGQAA